MFPYMFYPHHCQQSQLNTGFHIYNLLELSALDNCGIAKNISYCVSSGKEGIHDYIAVSHFGSL